MDFNKIEEYLKNNFKESAVIHFKRTLHWLDELDQEASEELRVAALLHDCDKEIRRDKKWAKKERDFKGEEYAEFLKNHQQLSAEIAKKFLLDNGCSEVYMNKVAKLIGQHEEGGSVEANSLMDADSVSFLENNAKRWMDNILKGKRDKEKVRNKLDYMFGRIKSDKAREIAKPFYEEAMKELESIK